MSKDTSDKATNNLKLRLSKKEWTALSDEAIKEQAARAEDEGIPLADELMRGVSGGVNSSGGDIYSAWTDDMLNWPRVSAVFCPRCYHEHRKIIITQILAWKRGGGCDLIAMKCNECGYKFLCIQYD